jgi:VIT1/CCC1 family predicted Fe2+/Mn2+ transporter
MADLEQIADTQAREELFAYRLYSALARRVPAGKSRDLMDELARQEKSHVDFWLGVNGGSEAAIRIPKLKYRLLVLASRILGPAFTIRWLERGEDQAITAYTGLLEGGELNPVQQAHIRKMLDEEREHEQVLERGIEDERRLYLGAAVLGLNDALVELTGGLTGLVSSIREPKLIGFASLVVGIAASMSMAASNFLSVDISDDSGLKPGKAATYTGTTYIVVVVGLVLPFFLLSDRHLALVISWAAAVAIIAAFSFYSAVMQGVTFLRRFVMMMGFGLGVAVISFVIGRVLGKLIGIQTV